MAELSHKDYARIGFEDFLSSSDKDFPFEFDDIWLFLEQKRAKESWQEKIKEFQENLKKNTKKKTKDN